MNSLSSYCGLVNAKIRASDKDLPVVVVEIVVVVVGSTVVTSSVKESVK